jgi:hypothetical protein
VVCKWGFVSWQIIALSSNDLEESGFKDILSTKPLRTEYMCAMDVNASTQQQACNGCVQRWMCAMDVNASTKQAW